MGATVEFKTDNASAIGYLAIPPQGRGPGLLLLHAWWGLTGFFKELADRLASEGFVVLAPDIYGGPTANTIEEAQKLIETLSNEDGIGRATSALDFLRNHPAVDGDHVGLIGFSMGAGFGAWLSVIKPEDISAIVLFYGGGDSEYLENFANRTGADYLGHFAEHDEYEPEEPMRQLESNLRAAGKEANFYIYPGTGHWFFENNRPDAYDENASRLAWDRTVEFLHSKLG